MTRLYGDPALDSLIYDGCGVSSDGAAVGSVRLTGDQIANQKAYLAGELRSLSSEVMATAKKIGMENNAEEYNRLVIIGNELELLARQLD